MTTYRPFIESQEIEAVARLAALVCAGCSGSGDPFVYQQEEGDICCPDCLGTGLLLPGLMRNTNRIVTAAEALHWLMGQDDYWSVLNSHSLTVKRQTPAPEAVRYRACWRDCPNFGPTPLLALAAAIEASLWSL